MQTVPSLVGSGTAVAAAGLGLVFALPDSDFAPSPINPGLRRIQTGLDDSLSHRRLSSAPLSSRPGTGSPRVSVNTNEFRFNTTTTTIPESASNIRQQRPASAHFLPPKIGSRRQSFAHQGETVAQPNNEPSRDSTSSHGSWMRRLSVRPLSHHGSLLSSVGLDSHSIAFSHGSSAPILSPSGAVPAPLPPNKLVKRASSTHQPGSATRRRAKSHLPTLRRPATSHQRSATLQQAQHGLSSIDSEVRLDSSFEQPQIPQNILQTEYTTLDTSCRTKDSTRWRSLFHSRRALVNIKATSDRLLDRGAAQHSKRIRTSIDKKQEVFLVSGDMVEPATAPRYVSYSTDESRGPSQELDEADNVKPGSEKALGKRTKRSLSMHLSSSGGLFSRTGSIRRAKRSFEPRSEEKRHTSGPLPAVQRQTVPDTTDNSPNTTTNIGTPTWQMSNPLDNIQTKHQQSRQRHSSSPLPPLSRLSSFNVDLPRLGSPGHFRPNQPSGSSQSSSAMACAKLPRQERSSTINSSDMEARGFLSGDDEDTDFKSDTLFDSIRTATSGHNGAADSPVESMFEESPPSTAGNGKNKRLSIQEILNQAWDNENRIMEEDENSSTPIKSGRMLKPCNEVYEERRRPSDDSSVSNKDLGRFSLEDDFDDDWARDEDEVAFGNQLSPPGSMNSRGVSPNLRFALANINDNGSSELLRDQDDQRPRSNLFDWAESVHDKQDGEAHMARPQTVHGKQALEIRGGRTSSRKCPAVTHVRSQSVPVVCDPADNARVPTQKYGTWGLGTKGASEDWDDDFEFDGADAGDGADADINFDMVVPASIQASQPSLKQHTGQIRELSLLVNDLKRLCRHGRELDLLDGAYAALWKEAEGIIALASPDEDELEGMDVDSSDIDFDPSIISDRIEDGIDVSSLTNFEPSFEAPELRVSRNTVIRERPAGRRRSVFSPDDDIFGGNTSTTDGSEAPSRPKTPESSINMGGHDVTDIVKSVLEAMQQRSISEATKGASATKNKLHFGTNNLKALVKRAGDLRDALSEAIRRVDQITYSPARTPRRTEREKSPAFTRVFTPEPSSSSPPKHLPHSRSNNSVLSLGSHDTSPSGGMSQRFQMMTVS